MRLSFQEFFNFFIQITTEKDFNMIKEKFSQRLFVVHDLP